MKKSIAENCIRYISTATALILALAMLCCANFSAGAKTLGSNLSITDASLLLADIDTTTNTTPAKTKDLIASGASVEVLTVGLSGFSNIYFIPSSNWLNESARFKLNLYINGSYSSAKEMKLIDSTSHLYSASVDSSTNYSGFQFIRMNSSYSSQLSYSNTGISDSASKNLYTMTTSNDNGWTPDSNNGTWSTYPSGSSGTTKTIYFDNSQTNWDTVKIYCWDTNNNNANNAAFPGVEMTKVDGTDNIYSYTYSPSYTKCIFSNGSDSNKTDNLEIPPDGRNYYKNGEWTTYTVTDPSDPVVTDKDLLYYVLNGTKVMVYGGEHSTGWTWDSYLFMTENDPSTEVASILKATASDYTIGGQTFKLGVATLTPGDYYQGHWKSGLHGTIVAGGTYIVYGSLSATGLETLYADDTKKNYLYSYDANSSETTKEATTEIPASITIGSRLSVNTSTPPGKSSLGEKNIFKYYLYNPNVDTYTEVSLTKDSEGSWVDTSELPENNNYQLITVLYDGNIYVRADADTFEIKQAQENLADRVTLTSAPETVEQNTALTLTATLENKNANAGDVKYTFTIESALGGTFENGNSEVTTSETSASVKFTPTEAGTYTFKVVASCDGYNQVEKTVVVTVVDEVKYYITGRFMGKSWSDSRTDMQLTKDSDGIYKYATGKTVAELSEQIKETGNGQNMDPYFFIHTGKGSTEVWYGGSDSTGHEFNKNTDGTKYELTAHPKERDTEQKYLLKFADTSATTKKDVVICLDTSDSSKYKLWYEYTTPTANDIKYTNDGKGTITGPDKAYPYANVTGFTITPKPGYELDKLTYNEEDFTSESGFTMPEEAVTVKATFKPKTYRITYYINSVVDDTLTPNTYTIESTEAARTLPVPLSRDGYRFSGWYSVYGEGEPVEVIPSDTTGDLNYYGNYDPIQYTVTFNPGDGELAQEDRTKQVYYNETYGELPTPTRSGYTFVGWYLGNEKITSSSTYNTAGNVTLTARYETNPKITVNVKYNENEDGSDKATVEGTGEKDYNSSGQVTVTPNTGYYISNVEFEEISYNYNAASDPWTYKYNELKQNLTITVTLTDNPKVTVEVYYGVESSTDKATVIIGGKEQSESLIEYNGTASISVEPKPGYYISNVDYFEHYTPEAGRKTFSITSVVADKTVKVYITKNPEVVVRCVDFRNENNGITDGNVSATVKPALSAESSTETRVSVEYGSNVTLTASATENTYKFMGFYLSGNQLSSLASYTYGPVTANTEILAKFDKLYKITIDWQNLDGLSLKIGEESTNLQTATSPYEKYMTQGTAFTLTTTINEESEYKLNASCFSPSGLSVSYSVAGEGEDNVKTKHYSCTVLASNGTITIRPKPATYSGSGYWGDKVLKIDTSNVSIHNPDFSVEFKDSSENSIEARMVCTDTTNKIYECPIPTGYTSFVLNRRNPDDWNVVWDSASTSLNGKTEFTASFNSGMKLAPKSGT